MDRRRGVTPAAAQPWVLRSIAARPRPAARTPGAARHGSGRGDDQGHLHRRGVTGEIHLRPHDHGLVGAEGDVQFSGHGGIGREGNGVDRQGRGLGQRRGAFRTSAWSCSCGADAAGSGSSGFEKTSQQAPMLDASPGLCVGTCPFFPRPSAWRRSGDAYTHRRMADRPTRRRPVVERVCGVPHWEDELDRHHVFICTGDCP
jgi:hypothetical protein